MKNKVFFTSSGSTVPDLFWQAPRPTRTHVSCLVLVIGNEELPDPEGIVIGVAHLGVHPLPHRRDHLL